MHALKAVNFVGGFARAANPKPEAYLEAEVDPIQAFAAPVMGHMNADHAEIDGGDVHAYGLDQLDAAQLVQMDRLGLTVQCERLGQTFKMRLPFPRAAEPQGRQDADRRDDEGGDGRPEGAGVGGGEGGGGRGVRRGFQLECEPWERPPPRRAQRRALRDREASAWIDRERRPGWINCGATELSGRHVNEQ